MPDRQVPRHPKTASARTRAISKRSPAEEALQQSEERFRSLIESIPDALVIVTGEGQIVIVNAQTEELFGYDRDELVGQPAEVLLPEQLRHVHAQHRASYLAKPYTRPMGSPFGHFVGRRRDGSEFPVEISLSCLKTDEGVLVTAAIRDITDRKRAEGALRESEIILRATLEATADGILVLDNNSQILHVNERFAELWRIPKELLEAGDAKKLHHCVVDQVKHPEAFVSRASELFETPEEALDTFLFKDGRVFERLSRPLMRDGRIAGRVWSFRDVTERKRAEEALRLAREELEGKIERQMVRRNPYGLTFREFTVLHLVAAGRADKEIARELSISPLTVHKHVANILGKMTAASRTEAGVRALREGLLD